MKLILFFWIIWQNNFWSTKRMNNQNTLLFFLLYSHNVYTNISFERYYYDHAAASIYLGTGFLWTTPFPVPLLLFFYYYFLWLPLLLFCSSLSACLLGGHRQAPAVSRAGRRAARPPPPRERIWRSQALRPALAVSPGAADKCEHDSGREQQLSDFTLFFCFIYCKPNIMTETTLTKKKDRQIINIVAATNACTRYGREHAHNTHNHCRFFQVYIYNMQMQYPVHNKEIPRSLFSSRCQQLF